MGMTKYCSNCVIITLSYPLQIIGLCLAVLLIPVKIMKRLFDVSYLSDQGLM